jgi:hypothetical protein
MLHACHRLARYSNPLFTAPPDFSGMANRGAQPPASTRSRPKHSFVADRPSSALRRVSEETEGERNNEGLGVKRRTAKSAKILALDPNREVPPRHFTPSAMRGRFCTCHLDLRKEPSPQRRKKA